MSAPPAMQAAGVTAPQRGLSGAQGRLLAQSVLLEEAGPSAFVRATVLLVTAGILCFALWTAFARVTQISKASGSVIPSGSVLVVQHLEGGIVRDILVRDGTLVEKGAPLIRLDPTATLALREESVARLTALELKADRLRSFLDGSALVTLEVDSKYRAIAEGQQDILRLRTENRDSRKAVQKQQIAQRLSELEVLTEQEVNLRRRVALLREAATMREQLIEKGLVSRIVYLNTLQELNAAEGDLGKVRGGMATARAAIAESRGRMVEIDTASRDEAVADLGETTAEISRLQALVAKLDDQVARLDIVAPVRGVVKGLRFNTIGGVIPPGGPVTEIVPIDRDLVVEAKISPRDAGHVQPGQKAIVKVTSYDVAKLGAIDGVLETVSATTFETERGEIYYKGIVRLAKNHVGEDPSRNIVLPGMMVEVDINTGQRTILEYLVRPAYEQLSTAFSER